MPALSGKRRRAASEEPERAELLAASGAADRSDSHVAAAAATAAPGASDSPSASNDAGKSDEGAATAQAASNMLSGDANAVTHTSASTADAPAATDGHATLPLPKAGSGKRFTGALRGVPVSSRVWKKVATARTSKSSQTRAAPKRSGIAFRMQQARKATIAASREESARLKAERDAAAAELRARREEKQRRRAENELKNTSYQVISDAGKLKRMSKKQLRAVKKTRMGADGTVQLVPAYD